MSLIEILETIFIGPLKLIFEIIFVIAERFTGHAGLAIIALSMIMNILVLPLYRRADAMQEEAKNMDEKLRDGVAHIKKTFTGDERMMILQTYYRQNNYKPTDALKGSVSLLLEIPFFMAAYQLLSGTALLYGVSMGPIFDLGAPDGLLTIGNISVNVLPFIMTGVNVISSAIYLKGYPLKTKIQLYGMALFFLVFLYTSPSGLVFYWTLNNLFSLVKTLFYKLKNPGKILCVLCAALGVAVLGFGIVVYNPISVARKLLVIGIGFAMLLPLVMLTLKGKLKFKVEPKLRQPDLKSFILGGLFCTVLVGLVIPSTYIGACPQEYIDPSYFHNPIWYIVSALCYAGGLFLCWMGIFYWLTAPKYKSLFEKFLWVLGAVMLVNYLFFGTDLGNMSSTFLFDRAVLFSLKDQAINIAVIAVIAAAVFFAMSKWKNTFLMLCLTAVIALGGMSALNLFTITTSVKIAEDNITQQSDSPITLNLSKEGKNVVVIMLDRAMGDYVPYLLKEKPELKEQYAGFTYYSNTISFGMATNLASSALYGGYEYTPVEMNKRGDESLASKHNEALKVMPVLFLNNGFDVTLCDPPLANYQWLSDLTIFDEYPEIRTDNMEGKFTPIESKQQVIDNNRRNVFCFALMKCLPLSVQPTFYSSGTYNQSAVYFPNPGFLQSFNAVSRLSDITSFEDGSTNQFLTMAFSLTHDPAILQAPDYVPTLVVDNAQYDAEHADRFMVDDVELHIDNSYQMQHYHANMASFIQLGKWLDVLRENDVYDNTRIIIVSDHGRNLNQINELILGNANEPQKNVEAYYPLLMVKDFDSKEFTVSCEFMTNADVPTLAMQGLIESPVNPFTGKPINMDEKTAHDQFVILSDISDVGVNNGNTFLASGWASVHDDIWNADNWTFYDASVVLTEHELPEE